MEDLAKEVEQTRKRQRTHMANAIQTIDLLTAELTKSIEAVESEDADVPGVLTDLFETVSKAEVTKSMAAEQKSLHGAISKLGKSIDKVAVQNPTCTPLTSLQKAHQLQAVLAHLYREGQFKAGDALIEEAALDSTLESKGPLLKLHEILAALEGHDLAPAIAWATMHRASLCRRRSSLEFALHRQQFTHLLRGGDGQAALKYARAHFSGLSQSHQIEVQQLMGALLYMKDIAASPYAFLLEKAHSTELRALFLKEACAVMGLPFENPLHLAVLAGCAALPARLRFESLIQTKGEEWARVGMDMQAEVHLGSDFHFHSIFVCPVSREQSTPDNPPVLLPCGHVICRYSMNKIVRANSRFKCPYCPTDVHLEQVKYVNFF